MGYVFSEWLPKMPFQVPFVVAECKLRQETKKYYHTFPNAGRWCQSLSGLMPLTNNNVYLVGEDLDWQTLIYHNWHKCWRNSQLFVSSSQPASQPASLILWDFFAFKNKNKWLNTLPDFKCSNKTVRRQYILNQVLKARINIVVITVTTFHHELKVFELEEACPYKIGCIFLENCQKGGGGCHFQIK